MTNDKTISENEKPVTVPFEEDEKPVYKHVGANGEHDDELLYLDLGAFEGPIHLLLDLARDQKVDLAQISILTLVDQYISYIENAKNLRIVIAADYLVMASWLAFLKSKLLLPQDEDEEDEPSGEALAEALTFQLKRLESMRTAAEALFARPRKNYDFWERGAPEGLIIDRQSVYDMDLYELLTAYGDMNRRKDFSSYKPEAYRLLSLDDALERLERMMGKFKSKVWTRLKDLLPDDLLPNQPLYTKSAVASTFVATLELAKRGLLSLRQDKAFDDIYLKKSEPHEGGRDENETHDDDVMQDEVDEVKNND